jgi:hypothetical protein
MENEGAMTLSITTLGITTLSVYIDTNALLCMVTPQHAVKNAVMLIMTFDITTLSTTIKMLY